MMEVISPATLSEGYVFEAQVGDQTFSVTVPPGGVEGGQKFLVPLPDAISSVPKLNIPVGHWKDGICNCFAYGPCHNHCLMAAICPLSEYTIRVQCIVYCVLCARTFCCAHCSLLSPFTLSLFYTLPLPHAFSWTVAAGQVIARLKLSFWGKPGPVSETTGAFAKICTWTIVYSSFSILLGFIDAPYNDPNTAPESIPPMIFFLMMLRTLLHYVYLGVLIYVLWNLRHSIRQKYAIPEEETYPTGCEDLLCAVCCAHCTAAQLMRHTTDYDTYNASCCSETGVPPHVPSIV